LIAQTSSKHQNLSHKTLVWFGTMQHFTLTKEGRVST